MDPIYIALIIVGFLVVFILSGVHVGVAMAVQEEWWILAIQPPLVAVLMAWFRTTSQGRRAGAKLLVRMPLIGSWRRHHLGATFSRMVGELLAGGAPLLLALDDARDCMTDSVAQSETDRIRAQVREGSSLHGAIAEGGVFPPVLTQLVALGEDAGQLADFLLEGHAAQQVGHSLLHGARRIAVDGDRVFDGLRRRRTGHEEGHGHECEQMNGLHTGSFSGFPRAQPR